MTDTAFITGANRGIGRAIALRLSSMGFNLALLARDTGTLGAVAQECRAQGSEVLELAGELTDSEVCTQSAVAAALEQYNEIDVLINNAGAARHEAVQDADLGAWRSIMDLNFTAALELSTTHSARHG